MKMRAFCDSCRVPGRHDHHDSQQCQQDLLRQGGRSSFSPLGRWHLDMLTRSPLSDALVLQVDASDLLDFKVRDSLRMSVQMPVPDKVFVVGRSTLPPRPCPSMTPWPSSRPRRSERKAQ